MGDWGMWTWGAAFCRFRRILLLGLLVHFGVAAQMQDHPKQQTGPFVAIKDGSLVWDVSTGLVWMRCAVGQNWNGLTCARESAAVNLFRLEEARNEATRLNANGGWQGYTDWKLPTFGDLETLVQCRDETKRMFGGDGYICYKPEAPSIDQSYFPGILKNGDASYFRTSSSMIINFVDGYKLNAYGGDRSSYFLRLVRSQKMSDANDLSEIIPEWRRLQKEIGDGSHIVEWVSRVNKVQSKKSSFDSDLILKLATAKFAALDMQSLAKALASKPLAPVPVKSNPGIAPKGEFETTAQYATRRAATLQAAEDEFAAATQRYQDSMAQRQKLEADARPALVETAARKALMARAWQQALPDYLGSPVLTNIRYDADKQTFGALLTSSHTSWQQEVTVPAPLAQAETMKVDLESGKIAPIVTFTVPEMKATWTLGENVALRTSRFEGARDSVDALEAFLADYPRSPEAPLARSRIYGLSSNSIASLELFIGKYPESPDLSAARQRIFDLATSSQELVSMSLKHAAWPEAGQARLRVPKTQRAEFDQARNADTASAWQTFIDRLAGPDTQKLIPEAQKRLSVARSREAAEQREREAQRERDRPRREAQQLCEAQKASCIAACPPRATGFRLDSAARVQCEFQCDRINCN